LNAYFLVRSSLQTNDQHGTFKCTHARCKTCPFIHNTKKISGPKQSIKIPDHFTCTSANVIYCITCTYCKKRYIRKTGRWLHVGDQFQEHLRNIEGYDKDASKPVASCFNLPNHSKQLMAICSLSLHLGSSESRKTLEQKFIFQIGTLNLRYQRTVFILLIYSCFSCHYVPTNSIAPLSPYKPTHNPQFHHSL